jgi:hypothetical protein
VIGQSSLFDEEPRYCIDTNVIVSFLRGTEDEFYGADVFAPQWNLMESLMRNGAIVAPRQVEAELLKWDRSIDGMAAWVKDHRRVFLDVSMSEQLTSAKKIVNTYPAYARDVNHLGDLAVITLADCLNITVLTLEGRRESSSQKRPKIPNVCAEFGIDCVSVTGFLRRERFGEQSGGRM